MRWAFVSALALAAACASEGQETSAAPAAAGSSTAPTYEDARSTASDADIRTARRAYRTACQSRYSADFCECMTASMAQTLQPADLDRASAQLQNGGSVPEAVSRASAQSEAACSQYRRS